MVEGSRARRTYPITLGRIEGHGRLGKPLTADYVLIHRLPWRAIASNLAARSIRCSAADAWAGAATPPSGSRAGG